LSLPQSMSNLEIGFLFLASWIYALPPHLLYYCAILCLLRVLLVHIIQMSAVLNHVNFNPNDECSVP
jgi:hypothetical protein